MFDYIIQIPRHMPTNRYPAILLCLIVAATVQYEIPLTRTIAADPSGDLLYTADVSLNKQQFKLKLSLGSDQSWVKGTICNICTGSKCEEKCYGKIGETSGLPCNARKPCTKLNETVNTTLIEGYKIKANLTSQHSKEADEVEFTIANKVHRPIPFSSQLKKYDGQLNLLHGQDHIFEKFSIYRLDSKTKFLIDDSLIEVTLKDEEIQVQIGQDNPFEIEGIQLGESDIQMSKTAVEVRLNTKQLLLPRDLFKLMMNQILKDATDCKLEQVSIKCNGTTGLDQLKKKILRLKLQSHEFTFPFQALISHSSKSELKLSVNSTVQQKILLGQFFFQNYAVTYDLSKKQISFQKLKNKWNEKLQDLQKSQVKKNTNSEEVQEQSEQQQNSKKTTSKIKGAVKKIKQKIKQKLHQKKYKQQIVEPEDVYPTGFLNKCFFYVHKFIVFLLRLIFWLIIIVIIANIIYNRKRIIKWFRKTFGDSTSRLFGESDTKGYSPAFEEQIDPTPTIAQGYDAKTATKQFWQQNSVQGI